MITAYLFDIDGTLLDSAADISAAVAAACHGDGREAPALSAITRYVGRPLAEMFAEFYPGASPEDLTRLSALYREHYHARHHGSTRIYPGVTEMLAALPGRKSTATTKHSATTAAVLELFGLRHYFDHIQGSENGRYKPDPTNLLAAAEALSAPLGECLMVGDTPADVEAGRRAGMRTCAVAWGYGDREAVQRAGPDHWIERPEELLRL